MRHRKKCLPYGVSRPRSSVAEEEINEHYFETDLYGEFQAL